MKHTDQNHNTCKHYNLGRCNYDGAGCSIADCHGLICADYEEGKHVAKY